MHLTIRAKINQESPKGTFFHVLVPGESLTDEVMKYATEEGF